MNNKALQTAILWAIYLVGAAWWLEGSTGGVWSDDTQVLLVIAPILEEYYKFIGYRWLKAYTIVIPITFTVFEAIQYFFLSPFAGGGLERFAGAAFSSVALLLVFKHVAFWGVSYFFRFRVWSLPFVILAHSAWNWWGMNYGSGGVEDLACAVMAFVALFLGFSLMREQHPKLGLWLDEYGTRAFWGVAFIFAMLTFVSVLVYVQWTWMEYGFRLFFGR